MGRVCDVALPVGVAILATRFVQRQMAPQPTAHAPATTAPTQLPPTQGVTPECYPQCLQQMVDDGSHRKEVTNLLEHRYARFLDTHDAFVNKPQDGPDDSNDEFDDFAGTSAAGPLQRPTVPLELLAPGQMKEVQGHATYGHVEFDADMVPTKVVLNPAEVLKTAKRNDLPPDHMLEAAMGHELTHFHTNPEFSRALSDWCSRASADPQKATALYHAILEALVSELGARSHPEIRDPAYTKEFSDLAPISTRELGKVLIRQFGEDRVKRGLLGEDAAAAQALVQSIQRSFAPK
jgi:hypothetical protein